MQQTQFQQMGVGTVAGRGVANVSVNQRPVEDIHENPHSVRYIYGAGLLLPQVNARTTGIQTGMVPQGCLVPLRDFPVRQDNFNLMSAEEEETVEVTAKEALEAVELELGATGFIHIDALTGITDEQLLNNLFSIVHPEFSEVDHECPEGLPICPTCRLELLDPELIEARVGELAPQYGIDPVLCLSVANDMRRQNQRLQTHYRREWNGFLGEIGQAKTGKNGALRTLFPEHIYIRACLHESHPDEQQAIVAAAYGSAQSEAFATASRETAIAIAEAVKSNNSDSDDKILMLMEQNKAIMEQMAQTNQMFFQLMQQKNSAGDQADNTEAPPSKPKK